MAQINLLPWREEYRQEKKQDFFVHLAIACLAALMAGFLWVQMTSSKLDNQYTRNNILKSEVTKLEDQVKEIKDLKERKRELLDRIKVIQDLQGTRPVIVRYFDELAGAVPDGVYLESAIRKGNTMVVTGVSESNNRVSTFLRQLDRSKFYADPNLQKVVSDSKGADQAKNFTILLKMVLPSSATSENLEGK